MMIDPWGKRGKRGKRSQTGQVKGGTLPPPSTFNQSSKWAVSLKVNVNRDTAITDPKIIVFDDEEHRAFTNIQNTMRP